MHFLHTCNDYYILAIHNMFVHHEIMKCAQLFYLNSLCCRQGRKTRRSSRTVGKRGLRALRRPTYKLTEILSDIPSERRE